MLKLRRRIERHVINGFIDSMGPGPIGNALRSRVETYVHRDIWALPRNCDGVVSEW